MTLRVLQGHVLEVLAGLPARHYACCVTSPPYWMLRNYGSPPQVWGGAGDCDHVWGSAVRSPKANAVPGPAAWTTNPGKNPDARNGSKEAGAFCARCGAWRGELGQEPDPELYVVHLVDCFRAVRRVLRDDGTLWVNLAGSYYSEPGGQNGGTRHLTNGTGASTLYAHGSKRTRGMKNATLTAISAKAIDANRANGRREKPKHPVYKALDWVDIPGLFARAMQEDGWLWRSDVTWVKPSALPESVSGTRWEKCRVKVAMNKHRDPKGRGGQQRMLENPEDNRGINPDWLATWAACPGCPRCSNTDGYVLRRGSGRPTKSCEQILLFVKRANYYYDCDAVREPHAGYEYAGRSGLSADGFAPLPKSETGGARESVFSQHREYHPAGRNLRDAWTDIGPEPLKDAHYAAYPSALPERCLKAGTSERGCCPECGAPWARVVDVAQEAKARNLAPAKYDGRDDGEVGGRWTADMTEQTRRVATTLGWRPTCRCQPVLQPIPCRALDCFGGSGTTGIAANRLGRDCDLVELKPDYVRLAGRRLAREPLSLFAWQGQEALPDGTTTPPEEAAVCTG